MIYEQLIGLDINRRNTYVYAKQADNKGRVLRVKLMDGNKIITIPSGATVTLRAEKPDGTYVVNNGSRNSDGTASIALTDQVLAVEGLVNADINVVVNGESVSSATFGIKVGKMPSGSAVTSSNEFLTLEKLIEEATAVTQNVVSTSAQTLTEAQKAQARANIGITEYDDTSVQGEIRQLKNDIADIENILTTNSESTEYGVNHYYRHKSSYFEVGKTYLLTFTIEQASSYLIQVGIGQSATSMKDTLGTFTFNSNETKRMFYSPTQPYCGYIRLYSEDIMTSVNWTLTIAEVSDFNEINEISRKVNNDFSLFSNDFEEIKLTNGYWYDTSGTIVNISSPNENDSWSSVVYDCSSDDVFTITGEGGSSPRLWCFVDSNNNILTKSISSKKMKNEEIVAPSNSAKLIINTIANEEHLIIKGRTLEHSLEVEDYACRITTSKKITVSKDGSGDYSTISQAINSINDSSLNNQYEIILKEGTYAEQNIILPPYTYLHGVGRNKPTITSEGLTDYVSVIDAQHTCRIANVKVVSHTKYCLHEDVNLNNCTVICENVDFEQIGTMNTSVIGNGTFQNAMFAFKGCSFKGGQVFSHTNSNSFIGVTQRLVFEHCNFDNAGIVLAVSGNIESNKMADCICEVVGCKGDTSYPLITCRVPADNVYPWNVIGGCNSNFNVSFDGETLNCVIKTTD